jgi:hypothetical protein
MKRSTALVITGVAGVLAGVLLFVGVVALTGSGKAKSRLGDDRFVVGRARSLADTVDRLGPLLFQDLVGGERDIYVQHVDGQWYAFAAHAPDLPRRCQLTWRPATHDFFDRCSNVAYPAEGGNFTRYRTFVDAKGKLVVDLSAPTDPLPPPTTTGQSNL